MQTSFKQIVLILAPLWLLSSSTFAQNIQCDPENRPDYNCFDDDYKPVCGFSTKDCPKSECGKGFYNGCEACKDPNVLYYRDGDCKFEELVFTCETKPCDPASNPQQDVAYDPVCALKKEGDRLVMETFRNLCEVCENSSFKYFHLQPCTTDRTICDPESEEEQQYSSDPVCAWFTTEDFGTVFTTVSSGEQACSDATVEFYTEGACGPEPFLGNTTFCLPYKRPTACPSDENPVCGFYYDQEEGTQHKIIGNACTACADPKILYHRPGPCVFYCLQEDENPDEVIVCGGFLDPICAIIEENGEEKKLSLYNDCIGCRYSGKKIINYTEGLCPGDKGFRCKTTKPVYDGDLNPVCGYSTENCNDNSCRKTYPEAYLACSDESVIWYSTKACPGDEGISCESYRTRPKEPDFVYHNVCGYREEGCEDNSCRGNYNDQYDACVNKNVIYFTKGSC